MKTKKWLECITVDERKFYLAFPGCPFRLVFEDNNYVGWYYCGERECECFLLYLRLLLCHLLLALRLVDYFLTEVTIVDKYTATEQAFKNGYEKGYAAAKAEEKHGHWIIRRNGKGRSSTMWVECSECLTSGGSPQWKRCPVCEAVMDLPNITEVTNIALNKMGDKVHGINDG